ncbi:MAG: hypothetical protein AAF609_14370 [Cyanobacteria bacterium P01_C01_bin.120]
MSVGKSLWWAGRSLRVFLAGLLGGVSAIAIVNPATMAQSGPMIEECNQFATGVNRHREVMNSFEAEIATFAENAVAAETLAEITAAASQYVDAAGDITASLETVASDLDTLSLTDTQLTNYRDEYVVLVAGFSTALTTVSDAMAQVAASETEDQLSDSLQAVGEETTTTIDEIETLAIEESAIIDEVNAYCTSEPGQDLGRAVN